MTSRFVIALLATVSLISPSAVHASTLLCDATETCFEKKNCFTAVGELTINNRGAKTFFGGATWRVSQRQVFDDGRKIYLASSAKKHVSFQHLGVEGVFEYTDRKGDPISGMTVFLNCKGQP